MSAASPEGAEINDLGTLMRAVQDEGTGGYDVDVDVWPNRERTRSGDGFFLVIELQSKNPGSVLNGQWWFWDDNTVMQVL
jgi:hypothetical protein